MRKAKVFMHPHKTMKVLKELISLIPPLPMPRETGKIYGEIRSKLEKKGMPIDNNDLWIAAHALAIGVVLVTNNDKEFRRIPHLKVDNWVTDEK